MALPSTALARQMAHHHPETGTRDTSYWRRMPAAVSRGNTSHDAHALQGHAGETPVLLWVESRTPMTGQTSGAKAAHSDLRHYGKLCGEQDGSWRGCLNLVSRSREIHWRLSLERLDSLERHAARHGREIIGGEQTWAMTHCPHARTATKGDGHRSPWEPEQ